MKKLLKIFKALADKNRIRILKILQHNRMNVGEISNILLITQPSVSRHLTILLEADLLIREKEQQSVYYQLNHHSENDEVKKTIDNIKNWLNEDPIIIRDLDKTDNF